MSITNLQIADKATTITPSNSTVLRPGVVFVGEGGNVAVETVSGDTQTFLNVPDGSILYVMVVKVLSTGTTATNMLLLE